MFLSHNVWIPLVLMLWTKTCTSIIKADDFNLYSNVNTPQHIIKYGRFVFRSQWTASVDKRNEIGTGPYNLECNDKSLQYVSISLGNSTHCNNFRNNPYLVKGFKCNGLFFFKTWRKGMLKYLFLCLELNVRQQNIPTMFVPNGQRKVKHFW